jgi:phospholipid/cholesterol/gamma-HCH transport system substrate-binding protein
METKSNYILVGVITVALLAALVGFTVWLARFNDGAQKEYDIFFPQVNGLTKGTSVSFSGVPVGQIEEIKLWEPDPEYVRVRIKIDQSTPILQGTVATVGGVGFTGVSEILLDGAVKGAPPITCPKEKPEASCPAGAPVIPVKPGALGELLNNAPLLLERLSTLTERLTNILSDKNQESLQKTLANIESLTGTLAQQSPQLGDAITDTQTTVRKFGVAADNISSLTGTANGMLEGEGKATIAEIKNTLANANASIAALEKTLKAAQPGVDNFSNNTVPQINALTRDLREASKSLKGITERLDQEGATSLLGSPQLPDYKPKK